MAKGGYRVGGGRPPGIKETRPRRRKKPSGDSVQAKIREMLAIGIKAKARMYQELIQRVDRNENLTITEKRMLLKIGEELSTAVGEKPPVTVTDGKMETPLEFLLRVMNDPNEPGERRDRAAVAACPYCHPRKGEGLGKKEEKSERAKQVGSSGKFAAGRPPAFKLVK